MEMIAKLLPLWIALGAMNLVTFAVYAYDKHIARQNRGKRRVPERTLLLLGALGGAPAMLLTMLLIRHKTRHLKFMLGLPLLILLQCAAVILILRIS